MKLEAENNIAFQQVRENADFLLIVRADESQETIDEMEEIQVGVEMERQATEGFHFKGERS